MIRICKYLLLCLLSMAMACGHTSVRPAGAGRSMGMVKLRLPRLGGGEVSLQDRTGSPVVITLFTTWCMRCQVESADVVQLHERFKSRGLRVIGIALDAENAALVDEYVKFVGFRFDIAVGSSQNLDLIATLGETKELPRTLLVDRMGRIVQDHQGMTDFHRLTAAVEDLLE